MEEKLLDQKMLFILNLQLFAFSDEEGDDDSEVEDDIEEDDIEDTGDTDEEEGEAKTDDDKSEKGDDDHTEHKMSKKEQSLNAQKRREREEKERAEREKKLQDEAYLKGKLESTKVNSFTDEPISDEYDLKVFELQKKISEEGGDPIKDLPKRLAQVEREIAKKQFEAKEKETNENKRIQEDFESFTKEYPDVSLKELLADETFAKFSKSRVGHSGKDNTLIQIYKDFHELGLKTAKEKLTQEQDEASTKKGKTPSSNGRKTTTKSYTELSRDEKYAYLKKQGMVR